MVVLGKVSYKHKHVKRSTFYNVQAWTQLKIGDEKNTSDWKSTALKVLEKQSNAVLSETNVDDYYDIYIPMTSGG